MLLYLKSLSIIYRKALQESWFNEQEKQMRDLTKEKVTMAAKIKQYEVLRTIKSNSDNITKIEVNYKSKFYKIIHMYMYIGEIIKINIFYSRKLL